MALDKIKKVRIDQSDWAEVRVMDVSAKMDYDKVTRVNFQKTRKADNLPGWTVDLRITESDGTKSVLSTTVYAPTLPDFPDLVPVKLGTVWANPWGSQNGNSGLWFEVESITPATAASAKRGE